MTEGRQKGQEWKKDSQEAGVDQEFSYQRVKDGICILRCYGKNGRITIPKQLEGMPVTELSDYAFAEDMEQEPEYHGELTCIRGPLLEELYLPGTIQRLGRYVFYNCIRFYKLSFTAILHLWEQGDLPDVNSFLSL